MTTLSPAVQDFRDSISNPERFFETCEGGDPGSTDAPSIWLLGLEPGWSLVNEKAEAAADPVREEMEARYAVEVQLTYPYNRKAFQFLAELHERKLEDYVEFAKEARPFEQGSKGYFKANLFSAPFKSMKTWGEEAIAITGFTTKPEYQAWVRQNRFAVLKGMIEKYRPKLLIGTGTSHLHDFLTITGTEDVPPADRFPVGQHFKRMHVSTAGIVPVAVIPHFTGGSHGLNSDESIRIAAHKVRKQVSL